MEGAEKDSETHAFQKDDPPQEELSLFEAAEIVSGDLPEFHKE